MDISFDQARDALAYLSPDEARQEWVTIGMAIKSEFGEAGFVLFDEWSQGSDKYKARDCISTWKSLKMSGGVGIGTLIRRAKDAGWQPKKEERDEAAQKAYQAELAARRAKAQADAAAAEALLARMADLAAELSQRIISWAASTPAGASEYLARKQVGAYGVLITSASALAVIDDKSERVQLLLGDGIKQFFDGFDYDAYPHLSVRMIKPGSVLVPVWHPKKGLRNVQVISNSGDKKFIKYGEKSGGFHILGSLEAAQGVVCVAEGYATAASIYMATGLPCLAAFDAGNLPSAAKGLAEIKPSAQILMCADNDFKNEDNAGVRFATEAAKAVGGGIVIPATANGVCNV